MNSSKVLLGILGGVAAGAIAGILFAPAKGSKPTIELLSRSAHRRRSVDLESDRYRHRSP